MSQLNSPLATYKSGKLNGVLFNVLSILFIALGLFIWCLLIFLSQKDSSFKIPLTITLLSLAFIGIGTYVNIIRSKMFPKIEFCLYPTSIAIIKGRRSREIFIPYKDIADTAYYRFGSGGGVVHFAFRRSENDEWYMISPNINKQGELIQQFRQLYIQQRTPVLMDELHTGKEMRFKFTSGAGAIKAFFLGGSARSMLSQFDNILTIDKQALHFKGNDFYFRDIQSISIAGDSEILLFDKTGNKIFSCYLSRLTSADVLVELLHTLITNKQDKKDSCSSN
jgi:hypothetical protein